LAGEFLSAQAWLQSSVRTISVTILQLVVHCNFFCGTQLVSRTAFSIKKAQGPVYGARWLLFAIAWHGISAIPVVTLALIPVGAAWALISILLCWRRCRGPI
jgi:hypothetical protein